MGIQETRCREQVTGSCRGFGVFAAADDGHGKTSWETTGPFTCWSSSLSRFLLVKGHTAAGAIQFCVCHGPDSTRGDAQIQAWWRRSAALSRTACQASLPSVVFCDASARGPVASLAIGDQAADWEETAGAEFHTLLLEWDPCLPATPGPHNDPAKPSGTLDAVGQG